MAKKQKREPVVVLDGKELSYSYHRRALAPDDDVSGESDEIKGMASALWTDEVKAAWAEKLADDAERMG